MSCDEFLGLGILYFYGELELTERKEFEKHLKECESCRNELEELGHVSRLYESLPVEEPSQVVLRTILERTKKKKFKIRLPVIKIFQRIPRTAFAGIGAVIIFAIIGYFISQRPTPYLEWESGMDSKIKIVEEKIYDLQEGPKILEAVDEVLLSVEGKIAEIREKIKNLEKELQTW